MGQAPSLGLLKDLHDAPPLGRRQRPGLHQAHPVTDAALVALVVGLVFRRTSDDLAVQGVLHAVFDGDDDGLVHLVADDEALADLALAPYWRALLFLLLSHRSPSRNPRPNRRDPQRPPSRPSSKPSSPPWARPPPGPRRPRRSQPPDRPSRPRPWPTAPLPRT